MQITYALMQALDDIEKAGGPAKVITRAKATALLKDGSGAINGVTYVVAGNTYTQPASAVVIATGGYGAGVLDENSLLKRVRPDLMHLPTTNGKHCTGDGIDLAVDVGGGCVGLKDVQVHPTGLVNPEDPHNKTKFLAAGALRGEGGVLLDRNGKRFCNELGTRDYVSGMMFKNQAPFRLVLGSKSVSNIAWHCKHYKGRGVMKSYSSAHDLAKDMGVDSSVIASEFKKYNAIAAGETECPWEKPASFCKGVPLAMDDEYHVAIVTPIVHYTMGGLDIDAKARVKNQVDGAPVKGLYAAGEAAGGVHRLNRLGGSALLECVVFGRVAGSAILGYLNGEDDVASSGAGVTICVPQANGTSITIKVGSGGKVAGVAAPAAPAAAAAAPVATAPPAQETKAVAADANKTYTLEEVAKHNTESDVWVIVNGDVLDVTQFMHDHPGGKMAIMTFAGKDASEEFNMLHEKDVVAKYAPECIVGKLKPGSKL